MSGMPAHQNRCYGIHSISKITNNGYCFFRHDKNISIQMRIAAVFRLGN